MFTVSVQKEYASKSGGYFYPGMVKVDGALSFFPRVNQSEDGNIKVTIPSQVSILSKKVSDDMYQAFCDAVKGLHEATDKTQPVEVSFGDEKIMSSVESHLTPEKDGSVPTVYESSKYNSYANITFDFSDEKGEKMFGIDTTLRARSDGTGKFISLPSRKGTDGNFYKEVSCSREVSDLLNQKGLALYDAELNKGRNNKERDAGQETAQKPAKKSTVSR